MLLLLLLLLLSPAAAVNTAALLQLVNNEHDDDDDEKGAEVNAVENVTTQDVTSRNKNCFVLLLLPNMIVFYCTVIYTLLCELRIMFIVLLYYHH